VQWSHLAVTFFWCDSGTCLWQISALLSLHDVFLVWLNAFDSECDSFCCCFFFFFALCTVTFCKHEVWHISDLLSLHDVFLVWMNAFDSECYIFFLHCVLSHFVRMKWVSSGFSPILFIEINHLSSIQSSHFVKSFL